MIEFMVWFLNSIVLVHADFHDKILKKWASDFYPSQPLVWSSVLLINQVSFWWKLKSISK